MNCRHSLPYVVPTIGTLHFAIALFWWCFLIFRVLGVAALSTIPRDALLSGIVLPLASCVVLLSAFGTGLHLTHRNSRFARPVVATCTILTSVLFIWTATPAAAQVHMLGPPGINHFYATWWLYSEFPHLPVGYRALVATTVFVAAMSLLWYGQRIQKSCRPTTHGR